MRLSVATWPRLDYESVTLVHRTLSKNSELFFERVGEALDLIRDTDPRAWRMIERDIRYIVNAHQLGGGAYVRWSRVCKINRHFAARLQSTNYDLMTLFPPYDEADWMPYWDPAGRRALKRDFLARVWPEIRATWTKK